MSNVSSSVTQASRTEVIYLDPVTLEIVHRDTFGRSSNDAERLFQTNQCYSWCMVEKYEVE